MIKQLCIITIITCTTAFVQISNADNMEYTPINRVLNPLIASQQTLTREAEADSKTAEEFSAFERDSKQLTRRQAEQGPDNDGDLPGESGHEWTPEEWYRVY